MSPSDPYETRRLTPISRPLARRVALTAPAAAALALGPALLVAALLLLWGGLAQPRPAPAPAATPTIGLGRASAAGDRLARAAVAYDAPGGAVVGALEPGRPYAVRARSGAAWVQLDVAAPGGPPNLVWVAAADLPGIGAAIPVDLATPAPAPATPAPMTGAAPAPIAEAAPAPAYLLPPATPAPRPVMALPVPAAPPCSLRELGSVLRVCNGVTP